LYMCMYMYLGTDGTVLEEAVAFDSS
jgi:hypothetical protein